jgi:DNA mismatch repair protein MutS
MMQQYRDARERHPGMLLLFRMGDFFELFESDAEVAAKLLGLTLTSRDKTIPMAGFPHHQLDHYLRRLLVAGLRVAICDQVEDPALAKGLVKREVTRIVTPGTLVEEDLLDPRQANHLASIVFSGAQIGLAWLEITSGDFQAADVTLQQLPDELSRLSPSECLCPEGTATALSNHLGQCTASRMLVTTRPDWTFDRTTASECLQRHFAVSTLAGFGFEDGQPCLQAAGALLHYIQETIKSSLSHVNRLRAFRKDNFLFLDEVTRRGLELTRTLRDGSRDGSLLGVIDRTVTAMGARLLQKWLLSPLCDLTEIEGRLDAVAELKDEHRLRMELRELLAEAADLQRLTTRASTSRATPRDLGGIARTLRLLPRLKAKVTARRAGLLRELENRLELVPDLRDALDAALVDEPPNHAREGGLIRQGYDPVLDELRDIARGGKEWIANFQAQEMTRTAIPSLKVGFNQVAGYYIEITHVHAAKVPADYKRIGTLKNAERYTTPELKEHEEKVLTAEEKSREREYEMFLALRDRVADQSPRLMQTADVLATLDVIVSLAELAAMRSYCRPLLTNAPVLEIKDGRHPVLDEVLPPGTFVPNDTELGPEAGRMYLITGPNMAGKSTYIRQVALLSLLAQAGSFVPAASATIGIVDRIFSRIGASDDLSRGQSTFMVEMTETANILNNATDRSLVILDEIGRGTSTYDGVSLAWAITEYLHDNCGCRALFATHYHELAQLAEKLPSLRNFNVLVREQEDEIVFLHKIASGCADRSYGIHVARLAGIPSDVLARAGEVLEELEAHPVDSREHPLPRRRRKSASAQPGLFADA